MDNGQPDAGDAPIPGHAILDLEYGQCRFPIATVNQQHRFCGAATQNGASWCKPHRAKVFDPVTKRKVFVPFIKKKG